MKARIVRIGNSQGVRIPRPLLEQSGLGEDVELEVREDSIVIRPARAPREGWDAAFAAMAAAGNDALLETPAADWDETEWEW